MKVRLPDKYYLAALVLLLAASIFIALPLVIYVGDTTTAACVIAGLVCVMTGSFVLIISGGEPMDPRLVGMLPAQGSLTLCSISSDIGIYGKAHFLPQRFTGDTQVMQLNPVYDYDGSSIPAGNALLKTGPQGFVTRPSCDLLIRDLKERNALVIPDQPGELTVLLSETIEDILDFASRVSVGWNGSRVTIILYNYLFIEGCQLIAQKAPQCCSKYPCPVCSLCGVLIAGGLNEVVALDQCTCVAPSRDVTITFLVKSWSDRNA